jgi:hypothetical protein|tara:strand:- start:158 stop:631 length:474 start_codon:yes stop_codon:yes gene_type:complete
MASPDVLASSSVEVFNDLINKDLTFTQKSLNSKTNKLSESDGYITRDKSLIIININTPYRERYTINKTHIEMYDFDFDQTKIISYEDITNKTLVNIITKGVDFNIANIKDISSKSFKIIDISDREIYIELTSNNSFFIKFKDNMNITNLVNFKVSPG